MANDFYSLSDRILNHNYSISICRGVAFLFNEHHNTICYAKIDSIESVIALFDTYCFVNGYYLQYTYLDDIDKDFAKSLLSFTQNNLCIEFRIASETSVIGNTFFVMGCKDNVTGKVMKKTLSFDLSRVIELMNRWIVLEYPPQK